MLEFNIDNLVLVFYKKDNDTKYSFLIKDELELTDVLLANCKNKRVDYKNIKYAVSGIKDKVKLIKTIKPMEATVNVNVNPVVKLAELVQKRFRSNMVTKVIENYGEDHCPTIIVEIELPDGSIYNGDGSNKKLAAIEAAKEALADMFNITA